MKIVLLGYMGSGKSTIGKMVAGGLGMPYLDLDSYIEQEEKRSVPEIFEEKGEIYFRKREHEYLGSILESHQNFVLSTGGGTPCYSGNMEVINGATPNVFYLKVGIGELTKRLLTQKQQRPLIKNIPDGDLPEFIGKHLFERGFYYEKAWKTILCDGKNAEELAKEIMAGLD